MTDGGDDRYRPGDVKKLGKLEGQRYRKRRHFQDYRPGGIKYYMLKVDPVKNMLFNPMNPLILMVIQAVSSVYHTPHPFGIPQSR
jgi:hypothetical protein